MKQRLLIILAVALIAIPLAYAGTLTMTTYYPAPTGNYDQLTANNVSINTTATVSQKLIVRGEGTGYAIIGSTECGGGVTGIRLAGSAMAGCTNYNIAANNINNNLYLNHPTDGFILFKKDGNTQMNLDENGNLAIGMGDTGGTQRLDVGGSARIQNNIAVDGTAAITGNTTMSTVTTTGLASLNSANITNNATIATLGVTGATTLTGALTVNNTATVTGGTTLSTVTTLGLASLNSANITNNATIATLSVTGATTLTGAATLSSTANIVGLTTMNAGATVAAGNLQVTAGTFRVNGTSFLNGNVGIGIAPNTPDPGNGRIYTLYVEGIQRADGFYYPSDQHLKKDIHPINKALHKVEQLAGVEFKWRKNDQPGIGVIAQNLEKVIPELVKTDGNGIKSVDYAPLTALLIESTKEQQKQIDTLKKEVADLRKRIK